MTKSLLFSNRCLYLYTKSQSFHRCSTTTICSISTEKEKEEEEEKEMEMEMEGPADQKEDVQKSSTKKGGLTTMPFIIANEALEKVASVGLAASMILYLRDDYHMSNAESAYVLFLWGAISNFLPIFGGFISDSYMGRFQVVAIGSITVFLGMLVLWLTAILPQAKPPNCDKEQKDTCVRATQGQLMLLFSSFALMSIGAGGIRPCSLAFCADQFDNPNNPKNQKVLQTLFNWYYASIGISVLISITVIVYIISKAGWVVGFGVPLGLMLFSSVMFLLGSSFYVKMKAHKSMFSSFAQVIAVAWTKRHLPLPVDQDSDGSYYHRGFKIASPTEKLSFLNKACLIQNPTKELDEEGWAIDQWKLCTVRQVEELKALIKVLPIWSTGIIIAVTISQHTFPVFQVSTMDRHFIAGFQIPPASFGVFAVIALILCLVVYDRIIVPLLSKFANRPYGLDNKTRIGIGLAISSVAMAVAGAVEKKRRSAAIAQGLADHPFAEVKISAMWLVPQYALIGFAEALNAIGQIEFYYSQFPKSMASIGVALLFLGMAVGNVVGSLIVSILDHLTRTGGGQSWVGDNLNKSRYDYYYWIISVLCALNVGYFLVCSWAYGPCEDHRIWEEGEAPNEGELQASVASPPPPALGSI